MIDASQLRGRSLERAELYGKPHIGCRYTGRGARSYERTQEWCFICGAPAQSCHHAVPLGQGERFELRTPNGEWSLRSPLFALCGSGTTGCHDGFHGGARFEAHWEWDNILYQERWWSGEILNELPAHHPGLYRYGRWEILDKDKGETIEYREAG